MIGKMGTYLVNSKSSNIAWYAISGLFNIQNKNILENIAYTTILQYKSSEKVTVLAWRARKVTVQLKVAS